MILTVLVTAVTTLVLIICLQLLVHSLRQDESELIANSGGEYANLGFDPVFVKDMAHWNTGTLETIYFALSIVAQIDRERFTGLAFGLGELLESCYDDDKGLFRSHPEAESSVQATLCAINLIKGMAGLVEKGSRLCDMPDFSLNKWFVTQDYIESYLKSDLEDATASNVYSACAILHNLDVDVERVFTADLLNRFAGRLVYSGEHYRGFDGGAFCITTYVPCISATYFVARLFKYRPGGYESLHRLVKCEDIDKFLEASFSDGGFASNPDRSPNLLHTSMACELIRELDLPRARDRIVKDREHMYGFLRACSSRFGYSFAPGLEPNIYATRNGLELLESLLREKSGRTCTTEEVLESSGWNSQKFLGFIDKRYRSGDENWIRGYPSMQWYEKALYGQ